MRHSLQARGGAAAGGAIGLLDPSRVAAKQFRGIAKPELVAF
jgi:hypothetical protein